MSRDTSSRLRLNQLAVQLLGMALREIFPDVQLLCPKTDPAAFEYPFLLKQPVGPEIFPILEEKMREILKKEGEITEGEMLRTNAMTYFEAQGQVCKAGLLAGLDESVVQIQRIGEAIDWIPEAHGVISQGLKYFLIYSIAHEESDIPGYGPAAITRITGMAAPDGGSLKKWKKKVLGEGAVDVLELGRAMRLFFPMGADWILTPKGVAFFEALKSIWPSEALDSPKQQVRTPSEVDPRKMHAMLFASEIRSYRDLPLRLQSVSNNIYSFGGHLPWEPESCTSERASIFCTQDQLLAELISSLHFILKPAKILGFEYHCSLFTRGGKFRGTARQWVHAEKVLRQALQELGVEVQVVEQHALRGPCIELSLVDELEVPRTIASVEVDFATPDAERLQCQGSDDQMKEPVMIHRSLFWSLERLGGLILARCHGRLPFWLAPEQARVLSVGNTVDSYAMEVLRAIEDAGLRGDVDLRDEPLTKKIYRAAKENVPYMVIVGETEKERCAVTLRSVQNGQKKRMLSLEELSKVLIAETTNEQRELKETD